MQAKLAILATLLSIAGVGSAQPMPKVYRSLEVMALSGASFVGTPTRIQPPAPGGEQVMVCVVFRNRRPIQDDDGNFPEIGAFLSVDKDKAEEWIAGKQRILVFEGGAWMNLSDPQTKVFDANLHRIEDEKELVGRMKETVLEHPEIEQVRAFSRPLFEEEAKRLDVEVGTYLQVPYDRKVERWAIGNLGSKEWLRRWRAVQAMARFKSPGNIERLQRLLSDPFSTSQGSRRIYPIRESAARVLASWELIPRRLGSGDREPAARPRQGI